MLAQIYQTKPGGTEFYLNMENPYSGGAYTSRPTAQFGLSADHHINNMV